jgi:LemA protein
MLNFFVYLFAFLSVGTLVLMVLYYNRFQALRVKIQEAWSSIDIQLQQRHNLIPDLLKIMEQNNIHYQDMKTLLEENQKAAQEKRSKPHRADAEQRISQAVEDLLEKTEAEPKLRDDMRFVDFEQALIRIEHQVHNARRYHNALVRDYNALCQSFPGVLFARVFNFHTMAFFESDLNP